MRPPGISDEGESTLRTTVSSRFDNGGVGCDEGAAGCCPEGEEDMTDFLIAFVVFQRPEAGVSVARRENEGSCQVVDEMGVSSQGRLVGRVSTMVLFLVEGTLVCPN